MQNKEAIGINEEEADRFIREKMMEAADRYEQELNNNPELQGLEPSPQVFEHIMAEIQKEESAAAKERNVEALLSEEDRRALEIGRRHLRHRGYRRMLRAFGVAAALLAIVFGISMVSEANRIRLMDAFNVLVGKEGIVRLGNEENRMIMGVEEREACEEIQRKLDIAPIEFMYRPHGMEFTGYSLEEDREVGVLFYQYNDTVVSVHMVNKQEGASSGMTRDGVVVESFNVDTKRCQAMISEIEAPGELDYMAEFEYKNCYYMIYGILPREEFIKMIENIIIF